MFGGACRAVIADRPTGWNVWGGGMKAGMFDMIVATYIHESNARGMLGSGLN